MVMTRSYAIALVCLLPPVTLAAQESGGFAVLHGTDTVAVERFTRQDVELKGRLLRGAGPGTRERVQYRATVVDDGSAPLVDLSAWRGDDPEGAPARQTARVIFKEDSAAVDDASSTRGVMTRILPTQRGAIPYLNLSTAWLEQATRRLVASHADSLEVPFFNLGGGQTVTGLARRYAADSASVRLGTVEFRFEVDSVGRILGGAVPAQGLLITRDSGR
jgi:hypothetical protein